MGAEQGQEAAESAAVFLFELFYNKEQVGGEEARALRHMFGPFPSSVADSAHSCVARLVAALGEDAQVEAFVQSCRLSRPPAPPFGAGVAFSHQDYALEPLEELPSSGLPGDFIHLLHPQQGGRAGAEGHPGALAPGSEGLLGGEVEKYLSGGGGASSSPEELCASLLEMLASPRSDDELQNEVGPLHLLLSPPPACRLLPLSTPLGVWNAKLTASRKWSITQHLWVELEAPETLRPLPAAVPGGPSSTLVPGR